MDTAQIDQITGTKGTTNEEEGVYKVSFPRDDVKVNVDGVQMPPFMGLTSWAAFKPGMKDGTVMVMGDMVLLQDEVNSAMSAALDNGLSAGRTREPAPSGVGTRGGPPRQMQEGFNRTGRAHARQGNGTGGRRVSGTGRGMFGFLSSRAGRR